MAQVERQRENRNGNKRDRAKGERGRRAAAAAPISLRDTDWVGIAALMVSFAEAGGAVRIGYTRDAGALAIGCYLGDDYATEYVRPSEDLRGALIEIAEAWLEDSGIAFHQALQELEQKAKPR
jgi:hypothetical protein